MVMLPQDKDPLRSTYTSRLSVLVYSLLESFRIPVVDSRVLWGCDWKTGSRPPDDLSGLVGCTSGVGGPVPQSPLE